MACSESDMSVRLISTTPASAMILAQRIVIDPLNQFLISAHMSRHLGLESRDVRLERQNLGLRGGEVALDGRDGELQVGRALVPNGRELAQAPRDAVPGDHPDEV